MTKVNDGGPLAKAIQHLRRITPKHDMWTGQDIADGTNGGDPIDIDYDIATILNAVVNGDLVRADLVPAPSVTVEAITAVANEIMSDLSGYLADDLTAYNEMEAADIVRRIIATALMPSEGVEP